MPTPLSRGATGSVGGALPPAFPHFQSSHYGVQLLPGQVHMIAGPSGCGKTALALNWALRTGATCLYYSADSDADTMRTRTASALTGHSVKTVRECLNLGLFQEQYGSVVDSLPIRFVFDPTDPTVADIVNALTCWKEIWGHYPELLCLDNLMNVHNEGNQEWTGLLKSTKDLHFIARKTKTAILVLHHTSCRDESQIQTAPRRASIQGKVDQMPEAIMTVAHDNGVLYLATVKHRHGPSDPMATEPYRLHVDFSKMHIDDNCTQYDYGRGPQQMWSPKKELDYGRGTPAFQVAA